MQHGRHDHGSDQRAVISDLPDGALLQRFSIGMPRVRSRHPCMVESASEGLLGLTCIVPPSGDWQQPALPWSIRLDRPAWVLLSVQPLKDPELDPSWQALPHSVAWRFGGSARFHGDLMYAKRCEAGVVGIPGHAGRSPYGFRARPHLVLIAPELPAPPQPGQDRAALLAELQRIESIELTAGTLRATVQLKPALRLTAFSDGDRPQLLAPSSADPCGVRTWFMEPFQDPRSPLLSSRRARCTERGPAQVQVTTDVDPVSGLELLWDVRLEAGRLRLRHGLRNHGPTARHLAIWSLVAGIEPLGMRSVLARSPGIQAPAMGLRPMAKEAGAESGPIIEPLPTVVGCQDLTDGLVIDGTARAGCWQCKSGLRSPDGIAALTLGRTALVSRAPAPGEGPYPEGGLNLTTYHSETVIEVEHVGPLVDLAPGACTWLEQELSLRDLPEHALADLPGLIAATR